MTVEPDNLRAAPLVLALSLFVSLAIGGCTTAARQPGGEPASKLEFQQQQFQRGKSLFLNKAYGDAAAIFLPLAQQGNVDAQYTLGYMYHYGYGVPRNKREALRWLSVAAARGHAKAQQALALINAASDSPGASAVPPTTP